MRKLTKEEVKLMVQLFQHERFKDQDIADLFGISRRYVNNVRRGERCSSITGIQPKSTWNPEFIKALEELENQ
jgi:hypothetical protein